MSRREVIAAWLAERDGSPVKATRPSLLREADSLLAILDAYPMWTVTQICDYTGLSTGTVSSYHTRGQMPAPDLSYGRTRLWEPDVIRAWRPR